MLGRKTVEYMTANQLGVDVVNRIGETAIRPAPTTASGSASRSAPCRGISRTMDSVGTFSWPGASGTNWWVDPREELTVVWMAHTPVGPTQLRYRHTINALVNQAIVD